ncbi:hypothetical protein ACFP2T_33640 [Plantactinospora solaniradicis]|uniref:Secreted protein n=1 Tax=Plantactinospora solaniradicis TaxID=1723736 RepID=A0ABW1KHB3_9ACTN
MRIPRKVSFFSVGILVLVLGVAASPPTASAADVRLSQVTARSGAAFALTPDFSLTSYANALANRIGADNVAAVLDTANRSVTSCNSSQLLARPEHYARTDIPLAPEQIISSSDRFCWNAEDSSATHWLPQGITGSSDADDDHLWGDDRVMIVASHYSATIAGTSYDKGARLSMVDRATGRYRQVLLVEPTRTSTPNYRSAGIHAGGITWLGNYLYVTDTAVGIRVFDMRNFLWVDAADGQLVGLHGGVYKGHGYSYVLPQVGIYRQTEVQSSCVPATSSFCFSSLTLDRSTTPDTLVAGEYRNNVDTANLNVVGGRVLRYPVDSSTRQLTLSGGKAVPADAVTIPKSNIQGVQTWDGVYYLGRSSADKHSFLFTGPTNTTMATWSWGIGGEDLYHEHSGTGSGIGAGRIWTATEHYVDPNGSVIDKRVVFAVPLAETS